MWRRDLLSRAVEVDKGDAAVVVRVSQDGVLSGLEMEVTVVRVGRLEAGAVGDDDGSVVPVLVADLDTVGVGLLGVARSGVARLAGVDVELKVRGETIRVFDIGRDDKVATTGRGRDLSDHSGGGRGGEKLHLHFCGC